MKVNTLVERPDGTAEFSAELTANELQFVVEFGMNVLLQHGYQIVDQSKTTLVPEPEGIQ
jgi:hypothetical protein